MAIIQAFFDESGKHSDHPVVAFAGVCAEESRVQEFNSEWAVLLRRYGLDSLHMVKALKQAKLSPNFPAKTPAERIEALKPFADCINKYLELGLIQTIDVKSFQNLTKNARAGLGNPDDPYHVAFLRGAVALAEFTHPDDKVSIICDDDQETAWECYTYYRSLRKVPRAHKKLISLSFADDKYFPALQAADMVVYLARLEAKKLFYGDHYEYRPLLDYMCLRPNGPMAWNVTFIGKEKLDALCADPNWKRKYGKSA